ncbi:MAG: carbonate dehydratase [Moraxellaceae bacterium]|nr:MAG: carbonate dehydratase [Moraxellaceae bacterium]
MLNRPKRNWLQYKGPFRKASLFSIIVAAAMSLAIVSGSAGASGGGAHWSYSGHDGPHNWGALAKEYGLCSAGINQSPINIKTPLDSTLFELNFNYGRVPLQIVNNGHTIQINYSTISKNEESIVEIDNKKYSLPSATTYHSTVSISGERYKLLQIHFHSPSEHHVAGSPYSMEAHFVHANSAGQLAVVGVLLKEGSHNKFISTLWNNMPQDADGVHVIEGVEVNASELLPRNKEYYHYRGSLTTPPCSEGVRWFVMRTPQEVSSSQIALFLSIIRENARPIQGVNSRFLLKSK